MVCGDNSSETIIKDLKGAVHVAHMHTKSLAENVSSLKQEGRQRDETIRRISEDQTAIKRAIQEEVTPRIEQSDANIDNLTTRLESIQDSLTTRLSGATKIVEHAESRLGSVPTAHDLPSRDGHNAENEEVTACQSKASSTFEERLHKLESALALYEPRLASIEEKLNKLLRISDVEEGDITLLPMRDRTRALSTKRRGHRTQNFGSKIPRSASISSTASSGYGSIAGENVNLSDVEEDGEDSISGKVSA